MRGNCVTKWNILTSSLLATFVEGLFSGLCGKTNPKVLFRSLGNLTTFMKEEVRSMSDETWQIWGLFRGCRNT